MDKNLFVIGDCVKFINNALNNAEMSSLMGCEFIIDSFAKDKELVTLQTDPAHIKSFHWSRLCLSRVMPNTTRWALDMMLKGHKVIGESNINANRNTSLPYWSDGKVIHYNKPHITTCKVEDFLELFANSKWQWEIYRDSNFPTIKENMYAIVDFKTGKDIKYYKILSVGKSMFATESGCFYFNGEPEYGTVPVVTKIVSPMEVPIEIDIKKALIEKLGKENILIKYPDCDPQFINLKLVENIDEVQNLLKEQDAWNRNEPT